MNLKNLCWSSSGNSQVFLPFPHLPGSCLLPGRPPLSHLMLCHFSPENASPCAHLQEAQVEPWPGGTFSPVPWLPGASDELRGLSQILSVPRYGALSAPGDF